ncbi:MAG: serine/threonine-protein phosphatase [Lachnospiraceae bacterium]|nr:serine/threonine-protein phosphatase [Lachnospiraceae bacterium]MBQ7833356.1 serine/threonine-protein phosphatase [Lachnospiraceae bacterium]
MKEKAKKGIISISKVQHIGRREEQQDNFGVFHKKNSQSGKMEMLAVVADGMGGLANGSEVSGVVVEAAKYYFMNTEFEEEKSAGMTKMVQSINKDVLRFLRQSTGGELSGSTMVAAYVCGRKLHFVSVGDSRIYLFRNDMLLQLNREHVHLRELYRVRDIDELSYEDIMSNREKFALTSYMGIGELDEIDYNIQPISLKTGDKLLLLSDGVFGTLSEREMTEICKLDVGIVESLKDSVLLKNKPTQDNLTAVLVEFW